MPQNFVFPKVGIARSVSVAKDLRTSPGRVVKVVCLTAGTIDLINDTAHGGAGASLTGFPATMVAGDVLPLNSLATVGIAAKTVSGGGVFNVFMSP